MRVLVTGGAGFIGGAFVNQHDEPLDIVVLDKLTYAADLSRVPSDAALIEGDIADAEKVERAIDGCDAVINFAAETHVDNSIEEPLPFARTNYLGTATLLEAARRHRVEQFIQVSTDEVYGSIEGPPVYEDAPIRPSSPYSASKAAADGLVAAYAHTYGLGAAICRATNNFGPGQHTEKLIPKTIERVQAGEKVPVYGSGTQTRQWLWVHDFTAGIFETLIGRARGVFNFGGPDEIANIQLVREIISLLGADSSLVEHVDDRPGHDFRYAVASWRAEEELCWRPTIGLPQGLRELVRG